MPPKQTTKTRGEQVTMAPVEPDEINLEGVYSEGFRPRIQASSKPFEATPINQSQFPSSQWNTLIKLPNPH
jgi:hypothetical protein